MPKDEAAARTRFCAVALVAIPADDLHKVCLIAIGTEVLRFEDSHATGANLPRRFVLGAALSVSLVGVTKLIGAVGPALGAIASPHGHFTLTFALSGLALTLAAILGVVLVKLAAELAGRTAPWLGTGDHEGRDRSRP